MPNLSEQLERKFVDVIPTSDWEIETDTGWQPISNVSQTVPYDKWHLELENCMLDAADDHIVYDKDMQEIFLKDISPNQLIQTKTGLQKTVAIHSENIQENMYDVTVESNNHRFYSNNILSHNTVTAAGYLLWEAMFHADQTILIAAHKFIGATEIMNRIRFAYENVPDFLRAGVTDYNKQSIVFDNGSRIMAQTTTESTGRGMSISILYSDEIAFIPRQQVAREFWTSTSLTLSTGGKAIITSTPNNVDDLFSELWHNANKTVDEFGNTLPNGEGINGFFPVTAHWAEHPERDDAWAAQHKAEIGAERFAREIELQFIQEEETLINPFVLNKMQGVEPIERQGQVRWYAQPKPGNIYLVALDPSIGTGGDPAAIQVFETGTNRQIAEWTHNKTPIENQVKLLSEITAYLASVTKRPTDVYYSVENNTIGEAILVSIRDIGEENIVGVFLSEPIKLGQNRKFRKGFCTTNTAKLSACARLKTMVESNKIQIFSKKLVSELRTFVSVGNTYQAKSGETDDLVMALLLTLRMLDVLKTYIPGLIDFKADNTENMMPLPFFMSSSPSALY